MAVATGRDRLDLGQALSAANGNLSKRVKRFRVNSLYIFGRDNDWSSSCENEISPAPHGPLPWVKIT